MRYLVGILLNIIAGILSSIPAIFIYLVSLPVIFSLSKPSTSYLLKLLPFLILRVATLLLATITVVFYLTEDKQHLISPFKWIDTIDNPLTGDEGWKTEHCLDFNSYCCKVKWLWRNGGNWVSYYTFGLPYKTPSFWSIGNKTFLGRDLQWRLGWNTEDEKLGRSKINMAIRWRKL